MILQKQSCFSDEESKSSVPFSLDYSDRENRKRVGSLQQLAQILGVTRRTLSNWRDTFPDCPAADARGFYNVEEWRGFIEENALDDRSSVLGKSRVIVEARERREVADAKIREIRLAIMEEKYRPIEEVAETWNKAASAIFSIVCDCVSDELIERGVPLIDARERAEEIANLVFRKFGELNRAKEP